MSDYKVKVKDSELVEAGKSFKAYCALLEESIAQYRATLEYISQNAITSGQTYKALMLFLDYVIKLEGIAEKTGEKCALIVDYFIQEIETADDYLYDAGIDDTLRDFSQEEFERLLTCLDDPWCSVTDSIGDWIYDKINKFVNFLNWDSAKKYLQSSHRLLLDLNDETKEGLTLLFGNVHSADRKYGRSIPGAVPGDKDYFTANFHCVSLTMYMLRDMLNEMADIVEPGKGRFTASRIENKLGKAYRELMEYYEETLDIAGPNQTPTIPVISDFASQPWASRYFMPFNAPISSFIAGLGDFEAFKIAVFNMFEVFKDKVLHEDYEVYMAQKQLLDVLGEMAEDYKYSESDEKKMVDNAKTFLGYVEKYGEGWYEYMNTHRDENGKLLLDGRTKEAIEFRGFLESLDNAGNILKYGNEGIEYLAALFTDYTKGLEILDSFERNYAGDEVVSAAAKEIRALYEKEFGAWADKAIEEAASIGYDHALKALAKAVPVVKVVTAIEEGIDFVGEFTGVGTEAKAQYDFLIIHQLYCSSDAAYDSALEKFQKADPSDPNYEELARDLANCFALHKKNLTELYDAMARSSHGSEQSYYKYCKKQCGYMTMYTDHEPNLMTYEEFLAIA